MRMRGSMLCCASLFLFADGRWSSESRLPESIEDVVGSSLIACW